METNAQEITIGSVVRLKSGGPLMTVSLFETWENGAEAAKCSWYDTRRPGFEVATVPKAVLEIPRLFHTSDLPTPSIWSRIWGWMSSQHGMGFAHGMILGAALVASIISLLLSTG